MSDEQHASHQIKADQFKSNLKKFIEMKFDQFIIDINHIPCGADSLQNVMYNFNTALLWFKNGIDSVEFKFENAEPGETPMPPNGDFIQSSNDNDAA